ncbi:hypothetical protein FM104_00950 [Microbacterium esteraromaticum]|uniref:Uncharacterized protein n=1 Tax=Microbacterium esteraromaticum TaxID=57043 RepID=A0A1R4I9Z3_9MICO|nr:hypothetical protein FM104_00950 [Microbacterium esteraromaticum]
MAGASNRFLAAFWAVFGCPFTGFFGAGLPACGLPVPRAGLRRSFFIGSA